MSYSQLVITVIIIAGLCSLSSQQQPTSSDTVKCPLDFNVLRKLAQGSRPSNTSSEPCRLILQGLHLVQSDYLLRTNSFLPPSSSSESCWNDYQNLVNLYQNSFDIRKNCGFETQWISQGCENITTRSDYENKNSNTTLSNVVRACNQTLQIDGAACATCTTSISALLPADVNKGEQVVGNVSDCTAFRFIYAAAFANSFGPTDRGTAGCMFSVTFDSSKSKKKQRKITLISVFSSIGLLILVVVGFGWFWWVTRKKKQLEKIKRQKEITTKWSSLNSSALDSITCSTNLIKFSFDEIQEATKNFSRSNIIGKGGYGNVYKGVLPDGTEVALKRFKNCSDAGDVDFAHEVEVIASVRHVNLVALRGYCIATTNFEGHQRIIVCELMKNGSLHDHLFGSDEKKLSWPIRQKIALGTARGLAYLHYGAQPTIIHRDIKGSNILLDDDFEPKVADFGLAKFAPEGATHVSTRVAGTMGFVAPEYALYGQLTERSDVYSFGVVLLEILSGKKALLELEEDHHTLLADWAWSLVRTGRPLDVVEEGVPELGPPEIMEKYVLLAVLCSHPQLYARPTMDEVVKILESHLPVPTIPERSIPITADIDDIERSVGSINSVHLSTYSGYQPYIDNSAPSTPKL
ncbi:putative LRR receptor-like serine/threonine-protein kinase RKF3 [Heracleum sosnowskyi]|uniref:non-specific serine/threonine protein kinase n=1 Tax=Heracleum sosnowskyi TaxID=360622 RepID=A0AAD8GQ67_9APIA|nr:putative LRR receptor-like serine/threonine-protein kinase RKF3 [Heracleum sosnowskyi]